MRKLRRWIYAALMLCVVQPVTAAVEHHCPLFVLFEEEPGTCWFYCDGNKMNAQGNGCDFVEATMYLFDETQSPVPYEICPDHCHPPSFPQDAALEAPQPGADAAAAARANAAFKGYPGQAWKKDSPGVPELPQQAKTIVTISNPTDPDKFHTGGLQFVKATLTEGNTEVTKYFRLFEFQFIDGKPHGTRNKSYRLVGLEMTGMAPAAAEMHTATNVRKLQDKAWTSRFTLSSGDLEYVLLVLRR